ncbi:MAG TPA: hypothetical protein DHM37_08360 [Candidatus Cloacimonas sp.]|jgi:small subunit ribosomal protein S1|nr:small subunit ribosomal protein [Candidatus Cloacimonadota bacterium]HCX73716.1 hypothetical protein [Candidatus Cloacimonas sp.]
MEKVDINTKKNEELQEQQEVTEETAVENTEEPTKTEAEVEKEEVEKKEASENSEEGAEFEKLLEESISNIAKFEVGDKVKGEIINITDSYIFVSLGGKRDAYAEKQDYMNKKGELPYKVGDKLEGYVVKFTETETLISKSLHTVNLHLLRNAYEDKIPVKGKVTGLTKGGYVINLSGIRAFCPVSQINDRPVTDMNRFMGESFDFRIIKFNDKGRNIVVSRRKIQEEKRAILKKEALENLEVGMVVKGKVTRLTNFGAFIDLGGIDGLLHISQFSWGRVESPNEMLNLGDEVETKIINIKGDKISLSLKALQENPFDIAIKELKEGDVVNCRILRNQPFGSFAEIKPGVEGLIPISELARGRRIASPDEIVSEGDLVEVQILNIDKDKRKISLSMKALQPDPWDSINDYVQEGNVVTGKIENIMNFGVFVKIKDGVTGLIPQSKLKQAKENITEDQIGEDYKVRVAKIDVVKKRISLEPTNLPESTVDKNNWRKFKKSNVQEVEGDNPFSVL